MSTHSKKLQDLHRTLNRLWLEAAPRIGLSYSEFEYLSAVHDQSHQPYLGDGDHGQHLHDIVAALQVSKASASAMISKLEGRGLIKRIPCEMDARAQHIILTDEGSELLARGIGLYETAANTL